MRCWLTRIADLREPFAGAPQDERAAARARVHRLGRDFNAMCESVAFARMSDQVIAGDVIRNACRCGAVACARVLALQFHHGRDQRRLHRSPLRALMVS